MRTGMRSSIRADQGSRGHPLKGLRTQDQVNADAGTLSNERVKEARCLLVPSGHHALGELETRRR